MVMQCSDTAKSGGSIPPFSTMQNLITQWLELNSIPLDDYEDLCMDLSDIVSNWLDEQGIPNERIWLEPPLGRDSPVGLKPITETYEWNYHIVIEVEGYIHDGWFPNIALPLNEYLIAMYPDQEVKVETFTEISEGED